MRICTIYLFIFISFYTCIAQAGKDSPLKDALSHLNYQEVADLKKIQIKYRPLMVRIGCAHNLYSEEQVQTGTSHAYILSKEDKAQLESYNNECLAHLQAIRRKTILQPAYESATIIGLLGGASLVTVKFLGAESFGGGFGVYAAIFNSVLLLKDGIEAAYNFYNQRANPVDEVEKQYVSQQCFIPHQLWPIILEKFMVARQNPFDQQDALDFLSFTLGLTTYAPKPSLYMQISNEKIFLSSNNISEKYQLIQEKTKTVLNKINVFFKDYEPFKDPRSLSSLRINTKRFILKLIQGDTEPSRPILLYGEGGIGKTHFAKKLSEWITELLPNSVFYEPITITTTKELEGEEGHPGLFLQVLKNQCRKGTRGSVVIMDESTWLNKAEFEAPAKRVFNGSLTTLSTAYFGKGIEGTGIKLPMPTMLILAAANQPIEEKNLRSRFDHIEFPLPLADALTKYAKNLFCKQKRENGMNTILNKREKKEIKEAIKDSKSFRDIEAIIPILFDQIYGGK